MIFIPFDLRLKRLLLEFGIFCLCTILAKLLVLSIHMHFDASQPGHKFSRMSKEFEICIKSF